MKGKTMVFIPGGDNSRESPPRASSFTDQLHLRLSALASSLSSAKTTVPGGPAQAGRAPGQALQQVPRVSTQQEPTTAGDPASASAGGKF